MLMLYYPLSNLTRIRLHPTVYFCLDRENIPEKAAGWQDRRAANKADGSTQLKISPSQIKF